MATIPFSDSTIANMKPVSAVWYSDASRRAVPGLRLMAGKRAKTFYFTKRDGNKIRQIKIGTFPELNVERARMKARELTNKVVAGVRIVAPSGLTLRDGLEAYVERRRSMSKLSEGTEQDYRNLLRLHAADWLDMPMSAITTAAVEDRFFALEDSPAVANKLVTVMRCIYKRAMARDDDLRDPTRVVTELWSSNVRVPLSMDLAAIMRDVQAVGNPVKRTAWQLLLHTGLRSGNLRSLTWDHIDFDAKTMHIDRMKNGEARTLPLSDHSCALFQTVRRYDQHWCFPSFRRPGPLDQLDTLPTTRQHDMRHHFTSQASQCHLPEYVIAWLRGDRIKTQSQAMAGYMHNVGTHQAVNAISEHILEETRC